jgi:hypothetical protein
MTGEKYLLIICDGDLPKIKADEQAEFFAGLYTSDRLYPNLQIMRVPGDSALLDKSFSIAEYIEQLYDVAEIAFCGQWAKSIICKLLQMVSQRVNPVPIDKDTADGQRTVLLCAARKGRTDWEMEQLFETAGDQAEEDGFGTMCLLLPENNYAMSDGWSDNPSGGAMLDRVEFPEGRSCNYFMRFLRSLCKDYGIPVVDGNAEDINGIDGDPEEVENENED